jgi:hypothetical protein
MTEQPTNPRPERTPLPAILTPCHGAPLSIGTTWESSGFDAYNVVDEITCPADGCLNSWGPDGAVILDWAKHSDA